MKYWSQFAIVAGLSLVGTVSAWKPEAAPPAIDGYGNVVRLPAAVQQPRDQSKICVDITRGDTPDKVNPGLLKLARYVNIYSKAGRKPATAHFCAILHGSATTAVLNNDSYARRHEIDRNPNLNLLKQLTAAGVEVIVCGQSLSHEGFSNTDVDDSVKVAVSALTTCVNCQQDGYALVLVH